MPLKGLAVQQSNARLCMIAMTKLRTVSRSKMVVAWTMQAVTRESKRDSSSGPTFEIRTWGIAVQVVFLPGALWQCCNYSTRQGDRLEVNDFILAGLR